MLLKKIFLIYTILFCFSILNAETGFRKYAGEFMAIDVSPRSQAMGGAFVALANDVSAAYHNPAGLVQIQSTQVAIMHTWQFTDLISYDYIGFTRPLSKDKSFAVSLTRLGIDDIQDSRGARIGSDDDWRLDPSKITTFNAADYVLYLSLGKMQSSKFAWGLNFKFVRRTLAESDATGLGFDGGVLLNINDKLKLGGVVRNITSTLIVWDTGEKELVRPTMLIGTSYKMLLPSLNSYFIPNVNFVIHTESYPDLNSGFNQSGAFAGIGGGEFVFRNVLFLRGGVDELQRPTFGIGIKIPHLNIDYAFTSFNQELGNSHRVGLIVDFNR